MSKIVTYRCNLCRRENRDSTLFFGVHHTQRVNEQRKTLPAVEIRFAAQDENHLCKECAWALLDELPVAMAQFERGA